MTEDILREQDDAFFVPRACPASGVNPDLLNSANALSCLASRGCGLPADQVLIDVDRPAWRTT